MRTSLEELQKALYQRLSNDEALMNKVNGVYDYVPEGTEYPYITLGEVTNTAFDTKSSIGENIVFPIHTWSAYKGKIESYKIINLILAALKQPFSLEGGFSVQDISPLRPRVFMDIDGKTYHGVQEIRFYINN